MLRWRCFESQRFGWCQRLLCIPFGLKQSVVTFVFLGLRSSRQGFSQNPSGGSGWKFKNQQDTGGVRGESEQLLGCTRGGRVLLLTWRQRHIDCKRFSGSLSLSQPCSQRLLRGCWEPAAKGLVRPSVCSDCDSPTL